MLAGRRPPGPPVYEGLRSGAPEFVSWPELLDGLRAANNEVVALLASAVDAPEPAPATAPAVVVVSRTLPDGTTGSQRFVAEVGWREYGLFCRLHLLDHRTQIKKLRAAAATA